MKIAFFCLLIFFINWYFGLRLYKLIIIVTLFLGTALFLNAQDNQKSLVADKVEVLIDKAWDYTLTSNDSALIVSKKALDLSQQNEYHLGEALAKESIGLYHEIVDGDIDIASKHYFDAIDICEIYNLDYTASIYHTLGVMFHTTDNYENAKKYYNQSLERAKKQNDSLLIKKCLINLGSVYSSLNDFELAESFMKQSIDIPLAKEMDYATYGNLGYLYVKQEKFKDAIEMLYMATKETPENTGADLNLYFLLHAKVMAKDSSNMKTALKRAIKAANSNNYGLRDKSLFYRNIADYLRFTGNYKDALYYRDKYIEVFEEIKEKQRDQVVLDMETKYETEKKDAELKVLKLETEKKEQQKRLYSFLAISGLVIATLLGFFGIKNRQKNIKLAKQKVLLETTLDEKNVLLKEIHHRVKNSFQIVSSLLYLQSENIEDEEAKLAIKEAENRVRSMVLIHQKLYNKDELVGINTKEYFSDLVKDIFESHQFKSEPIKYDLNVESHILDIETITPVGLILNELIINTLKHAFNEVNEKSNLHIAFTKENNNLILKVKDNGNGFDGDIKSNSFGIKLMKALSKKLKATLDYFSKPNEGTEVVLTITKFNILS